MNLLKHVKFSVPDDNKWSKKFTICLPPGSIYPLLALGIVYDWKVAGSAALILITLATIWENFS